MPTHSGKSFALGTQGNPASFLLALDVWTPTYYPNRGCTHRLQDYSGLSIGRVWNTGMGQMPTASPLLALDYLSFSFSLFAFMPQDIYNLAPCFWSAKAAIINSREKNAKSFGNIWSWNTQNSKHIKNTLKKREREREKRGGACRSDCLCLLVSQALEITSKGIAALKRAQIELQCGSWRSLAGGVCSDGVILSHKGRLCLFSKEATSSPLSSRQNRWNDSCKSHLWPTKTPKNSCLESMYMYPRCSAHTANEVTSWSTKHKHLRFAQGLDNSLCTGGFSRTLCFYSGRYSHFSLQPRHLHTLQAFVSHFLSTYKYILEPFRPSNLRPWHHPLLFEPQERQESLVPSPRKTIHMLSPWQRRKQTNGAIQTGANT